MSDRFLKWFGRMGCAALLAVPLIASPKPMPAAEHGGARSTSTERNAWPAEMLTGKIMMVDPAQHLLVVQDASGVPFDMVVTHTTRIRSGDQRLNLGDLTSDVNKNVTLRFTPERRGDVADSIHVGG